MGKDQDYLIDGKPPRWHAVLWQWNYWPNVGGMWSPVTHVDTWGRTGIRINHFHTYANALEFVDGANNQNQRARYRWLVHYGRIPNRVDDYQLGEDNAD